MPLHCLQLPDSPHAPFNQIQNSSFVVQTSLDPFLNALSQPFLLVLGALRLRCLPAAVMGDSGSNSEFLCRCSDLSQPLLECSFAPLFVSFRCIAPLLPPSSGDWRRPWLKPPCCLPRVGGLQLAPFAQSIRLAAHCAISILVCNTTVLWGD